MDCLMIDDPRVVRLCHVSCLWVGPADATANRPPISTSPETKNRDRQEPFRAAQSCAEDQLMVKLNADQDLRVDVEPATAVLTIGRLRPQKPAVRKGRRQARASQKSKAIPDGDKGPEDSQLLDIPAFLDRRNVANGAPVSKKARRDRNA